MEDSKLRKVYDTIVKEGYDVPDFATFETDMRDDKNLTQVRDRLVEDGYELPEFGQFKIDMFGAPQESKATSAATKGGENGYTFTAEELGIDERNAKPQENAWWQTEVGLQKPNAVEYSEMGFSILTTLVILVIWYKLIKRAK